MPSEVATFLSRPVQMFQAMPLLSRLAAEAQACAGAGAAAPAAVIR